MELVRKEVIPYQWETLNDRVPEAAPSYCMHNFKVAGRMNKEKRELGSRYQEPTYTFRGFEALPDDPRHPDDDKFYGCVFQDSDFSKWIEAVAYSLTQHPDPELEKIADGAIDIVCAAQLENGYLDTYYIINGMDKMFTNLKDHHELYCFGHLTEGAVAYYQATGKDKLLKAAMRFADFIASYFGTEEGKCKGYPGHEIAEMALVRLYEVTGDEKYKKLAEYFVNQRGTQPYYFDSEGKVTEKEKKTKIRYQYYQAHLPVREQKTAMGHAVRAVYLYSGMADVARLTGDDSLYQELALHNGVLSGMALDGKSFFYVNPLSVNPRSCHDDPGKQHVKPVRQKWFGCACCPPNLARLISSIGSYAYTENEDTLWVHLYAGGTVEKEVNGQKAQVVITSGLPWDGDVTLKVESEQPVTMTVALRIPGWCGEDFELEGAVGKECRMENGYLYVSGEWKEGDLLKLRFAMKVKVMQADSRVRQDEGKVAIMRGPVVYCLEEADNGQGLPLVRVKPDAVFTEEKTDELGFTMIMLRVDAKTKKPVTVENGLYQTWQKPVYEGKELRFIPYYAWANRGEGEMEVWVNQL